MADWCNGEAKNRSLSGRRTALSALTTASDVIAGHDLHGKEAIVTGRSSGLGAETTRMLANAGVRVVAFSDVICSDELNRLRRCAADDCDNVYVDPSKNRCRRFCSASCAHSTHVAACWRRQAWPQP